MASHQSSNGSGGDESRTPLSSIFPIGYQNSAGECGYCHGKRGGQPPRRFSYFATATALSPRLYRRLLDRGWRRSGTLLYRPNQRDSCCPHYTLRLDCGSFSAAKDQRQAVNRFTRFVLGDSYAAEVARRYPRSREQARRRDREFDLVERVREAESDRLPTTPFPPPPPPQRKQPPPTLEPAHRFEVALEPDAFTEEKFAVFENYQRVVHREPAEAISRSGFRRFLCNSPLTRDDDGGDDDGDASGEGAVDGVVGGQRRQMGSFHQCYRLDGALVAVGVLDLLPGCVVAVYFFYHESIHTHSPGKLSALREIALAMERGCRWWYSGYYIHSCPKMRYKMDYAPQYVLDPETLDWDPVDGRLLALFDRQDYVSLSRERKAAEKRGDGDVTMTDGVPTSQDEVEDEKTRARRGKKRAAPTGKSPVEGGEKASEEELEREDEEDEDVEQADDGGGGGGDLDQGSLFESNMPGIPSLKQMREIDLDHIVVQLGSQKFVTSNFAFWRKQDISDREPQSGSLKAAVAELVAAIGPDLKGKICLDFGRGSRN